MVTNRDMYTWLELAWAGRGILVYLLSCTKSQQAVQLQTLIAAPGSHLNACLNLHTHCHK